MKKIIALCSIVTTTALSAPLSPMQEGLWEITSRTDFPGRQTPPHPVTSRACYTQQDVEQESAATPKDDQCAIRNYQHIGNKATWEMTCAAGKETISGHGSVIFESRTAYRGTVTLIMKPEGQPEIQMNNRYSGRRLGSCEQ